MFITTSLEQFMKYTSSIAAVIPCTSIIPFNLLQHPRAGEECVENADSVLADWFLEGDIFTQCLTILGGSEG